MTEIQKDGKTLLISRCKYDKCAATIFWVVSKENGDKRMPINLENYNGVYGRDLVFDRNTMTPHWATCPGAEFFKKGKQKEPSINTPFSNLPGGRR